MKDEKIFYTTVDEYIRMAPVAAQPLLNQMRALIKAAVPGAEECISYNIPCYKLGGPLVYFAGYKKHIGFYPMGSGIAAFQQELSGFKSSKGAVQFPLDKPLPERLILAILQFRIERNKEREAAKAGAKNAAVKKP